MHVNNTIIISLYLRYPHDVNQLPLSKSISEPISWTNHVVVEICYYFTNIKRVTRKPSVCIRDQFLQWKRMANLRHFRDQNVSFIRGWNSDMGIIDITLISSKRVWLYVTNVLFFLCVCIKTTITRAAIIT